ncbi:Hypothetical protein, putative [Bodo saltans]|uniref:Beta-lactamase-related domain-containing protein n=1 Tax=Bodo saltans TaxID=75058 RepID=A0A0S4JS09_BODSA|nr:Hypothetical protein, putative [Bodo saltans]|eukprot:CUG92757.1 Hypothetical protein, putative [Bodo saltans]
MLMMHTSSIVDNSAVFTSPTTSGSGASQTSLRSYAEGYFLSSGTATVATDIWNSLTPGLVTSYQYARSNVVLLSYILEQVIAENPTLVSSAQKTVGAYLQESLFAPLGMLDTFFVLPDGSYPRTSTNFGARGSDQQDDATTTITIKSAGASFPTFVMR